MRLSILLASTIVGAALSVACDRAMATGTTYQPTPVVIPTTPNAQQDQHQGQGQSQAIGNTTATANTGPQRQKQQQGQTANGGSGGNAIAAGGAGGTAAGGNSSLTDSSQSSTNAYALALPQPVSLAPMGMIQCDMAEITQSARSLGWSFISWADAKTDSSDCTLVRIRNEKVEQCQFGDAKQIEDLVVARHIPTYTATANPDLRNLTMAECQTMKAPPPVARVESPILFEPPSAGLPAPGAAVANIAKPKPSYACAHPKPLGTDCARPNGVRKADPETGLGCCYYPPTDPCAKCLSRSQP